MTSYFFEENIRLSLQENLEVQKELYVYVGQNYSFCYVDIQNPLSSEFLGTKSYAQTLGTRQLCDSSSLPWAFLFNTSAVFEGLCNQKLTWHSPLCELAHWLLFPQNFFLIGKRNFLTFHGSISFAPDSQYVGKAEASPYFSKNTAAVPMLFKDCSGTVSSRYK